ncbi:MAG: DNA repair protein RecO [Acutalibacteraceae bacterium]|nr:DNA repair protein RecO [Acutalibacteraceae bacterium]
MEQTQFTIDGLIIREQNIGDNDKLVTILSRNNGVISAYAAGAKNIKSKKGAATTLLSYSSLTLKKKGESYRITEATPIQVFFKTGSDIEALSLAQYFCELTLYHANEDENSETVLRLILNALHFICEKKRNIHLIKAIVELRLMTLIGYMPNLVACKKCMNFEEDIMYFDTAEGCLYCSGCAAYEQSFAVINATLLSSLRHIVYSDFNKLFAFTLPDDASVALSGITEKYLINKTEQNIKTLKFFNSLF